MTSKTPILDKMVNLGSRLYPTTAFFELTHSCNGDCAYCYIEDKNNSIDLDTISVKRVLDKLAKSGVLKVIFTGGEIFTRPDIIEILSYAIAKDFWLLGVMTNGTLLTREHMDFIIRNRDYFSRSISMTVFSHIPEVNDSYFSIRGALEKIISNGEYLKDGGVGVHLKLNVMDFNLDTFMETYDVLKRMGFSVSYYVGALFSSGKRTAFLRKYSEKDFIKKFLLRLPASEIEAKKKELLVKLKSDSSFDLCNGRFTGICIDNMGKIKPCVGFTNTDSCNILEQGELRELLAKSRTILEVRRKSKLDIVECRECAFFKYCTPCLANMDAEHACLTAAPTKSCSMAQAIYEL
jgi:radical SAM protein with 4Fe4S-binding SPASM domain